MKRLSFAPKSLPSFFQPHIHVHSTLHLDLQAPCFPSHPAATFLYLPRVIGASNSSSLLLSLPFSRLSVSVSFGPENVFLSRLGRVLKKLLGS